MDRKYKGWSIQEREREYERLKQEWNLTRTFNQKAYDAFIDRIVRQLGI